MDRNWEKISLKIEATREGTDKVFVARLPDIPFRELQLWTDEQLGNLLRNVIRRKLMAAGEPATKQTR